LRTREKQEAAISCGGRLDALSRLFPEGMKVPTFIANLHGADDAETIFTYGKGNRQDAETKALERAGDVRLPVLCRTRDWRGREREEI
jgi:hypothetical protein